MSAKKSLKELGYGFNTEGHLRKIQPDGKFTNEPFHFHISSQHQECQAHYEELGAAVTEYVYDLLETQEQMMRLPVPKKSVHTNGTFIFVSKDYDKKDILLILIHGSGAVRAGQWARSLIINESLDKGTQIPYIRKALSKDYGIVILNTNDNYRDGQKIPHSSTAEEHAYYVWNTYISKAAASSIVIVAHSYGGVVAITLSEQVKEDFQKRVKALAFTDSVHGYTEVKLSDFIKKMTKNWISSNTPVDTPMRTPEYDITRVSAGHPKHEMTSYACMDAVFKYFEEMISKN